VCEVHGADVARHPGTEVRAHSTLWAAGGLSVATCSTGAAP
jgi:hypothetical protein